MQTVARNRSEGLTVGPFQARHHPNTALIYASNFIPLLPEPANSGCCLMRPLPLLLFESAVWGSLAGMSLSWHLDPCNRSRNMTI